MSRHVTTPLWKHPYPKSTQLDAFRRHINLKYGLNLDNYEKLHRWSVQNIETFHTELWGRCGLTYSIAPTSVAYGLERMWPPPQWFPGARLNYSENLLRTGLTSRPDSIAISACREGGTEWRHLTWKQLEQQVQLYASAMTNAGLRQGDRVAAVVTNSVESVVLLLATGWLGAIFSSTSPDMGVNGIVERFVQIQPKLLFVESIVTYATKKVDLRSKLALAVGQLNKRSIGERKVIDVSNQDWTTNSM
jgi:acetoacetyl-CoA synthetase